jgi:hypothetical protein
MLAIARVFTEARLAGWDCALTAARDDMMSLKLDRRLRGGPDDTDSNYRNPALYEWANRGQ